MTLDTLGYQLFEPDPQISKWVEAARPVALALSEDEQLKADWLRHGGTWFAGVNVFPNDATGTWAGGPTLAGAVIEAARSMSPFDIAWDTAQISIPYRGYPKQDADESDANHRFRLNRDAAHLDGLLPVGPNRRRFMMEYHAFILGLPLNRAPAEAAPLVVWESSHKVIQSFLAEAFEGTRPDSWDQIDLTDRYADIRRQVFSTCKRVEISVPPGTSYLVHRFALHGVAPWPETINGPKEGRMIAYFRPHWRGDLQNWLDG
ncbi:MAG: hypothetical protein AAF826_01020 [Pseudomonadota bacterium]